ncbi:unnamed protein product [Bemisia tabaci]|uniref:C2H2-type domain-containing protein n=1 Tax=Bemisia tabaci TaxID=7038 RepID=A0A9P0AMY1_BEMTA|nr:PREDICTED: zinc finger protein 28-like [Bemisia tabaci]CAH0394205.1 unnamed protein product [Bemisia tabaci]
MEISLVPSNSPKKKPIKTYSRNSLGISKEKKKEVSLPRAPSPPNISITVIPGEDEEEDIDAPTMENGELEGEEDNVGEMEGEIDGENEGEDETGDAEMEVPESNGDLTPLEPASDPLRETSTKQEPPLLVNVCDCGRAFNTVPGLKRHARACPIKEQMMLEEKRAQQAEEDAFDGLGDPNPEDPYMLPFDTAANNQTEIDRKPFIDGKCHCCGEDNDTAHRQGEFECTDCEKFFKLKSSLERHRRVIHNEGETYACPECDARCPDKGTLARHMYTHTGLKPVQCPCCHKEFSRKYHLIRHNLQTGCDGTERPTYPCQVCGRTFNRKDNLREHLRAHAGQTKRKKRYVCEHCDKEFYGTTLLHIHRRTHTGERPYVCDFCPKRFPSSGAMKKHRRKHTGERPYECKQCTAKFAAKETLNRHMKTHSSNKPHACHFCGKSFIQASQLRAHVFHHTGENGFTCDYCGKAFNRKSRLDLHVKYIHEGAKPFVCEETDCQRTFVRKEDLARHQVLHSGVKAHRCPICDKSFAMKSSLKIHLLTHTKEPPRSCDECGRAFIRQDCLLRHMRSKHRDMLEEIMAEAEKKKLQAQLLFAASENQVEKDPLGPAAFKEPTLPEEPTLADSVRELLYLLVDETTLKAFGWPDTPVDRLLESVIRRCGHEPVIDEDIAYTDRLRENAKLLFTVVIDDSAVKLLLNNQSVDEVILHVLRLASS